MIAATLAVLLTQTPIGMALADAPACGSSDGTSFHGSGASGSVGVSGSCVATGLVGPGGAVVVVDCGSLGVNVPVSNWNPVCGPAARCPPLAGGVLPHRFGTGYVTAAGFLLIATWCPDAGVAAPSVAALRDEVIRLLPVLAVGVSPAGGVSLVNFRTLFWVVTPVVRELGRSRLLGLPVALRVRFVSAVLDFGDGSSGVLSEPGVVYDRAADCGGCADRFGHGYVRRGLVTVTGTVSWAAEFRIGAGGWLPIPGAVTGPASRTSLQIKQSHGVLVAPRNS
jgi:hypothetical protein